MPVKSLGTYGKTVVAVCGVVSIAAIGSVFPSTVHTLAHTGTIKGPSTTAVCLQKRHLVQDRPPTNKEGITVRIKTRQDDIYSNMYIYVEIEVRESQC